MLGEIHVARKYCSFVVSTPDHRLVPTSDRDLMDFKASSMEIITRAIRSAVSIIGSKHFPMVHVCLDPIANDTCLPFNILGSQRAKCSAIKRSQLMKLDWRGAEQPLPGQTIKLIIDRDGSLSNVPVWATVATPV